MPILVDSIISNLPASSSGGGGGGDITPEWYARRVEERLRGLGGQEAVADLPHSVFD